VDWSENGWEDRQTVACFSAGINNIPKLLREQPAIEAGFNEPERVKTAATVELPLGGTTSYKVIKY